jgi:hypothetical protein
VAGEGKLLGKTPRKKEISMEYSKIINGNFNKSYNSRKFKERREQDRDETDHVASEKAGSN